MICRILHIITTHTHAHAHTFWFFFLRFPFPQGLSRLFSWTFRCKPTRSASIRRVLEPDVCWRMLTWRMLTYADVCWCCKTTRTYDDVCWRMRTYANVAKQLERLLLARRQVLPCCLFKCMCVICLSNGWKARRTRHYCLFKAQKKKFCSFPEARRTVHHCLFKRMCTCVSVCVSYVLK